MIDTGLKEYKRDLALLGRSGDAQLAPPTEEELVDLARRYLLQDSGTQAVVPTSARLTYLRWKPSVSTTAAYTLFCEDGQQVQVVAKRYGDGKAEWLGQRAEKRTLQADAGVWTMRAVVEESNLILRVFPSDRNLPGHQTLLDAKSLARVVEEAGLVPSRSVRRRRTRTELLRYKPERRSIWRVDLSLRHGDTDLLTLAARVLPLEQAAMVAAQRKPGGAIDQADIGPQLLASVGHTGLLLEQWLELDVPGDGCFELSRETGRLVARLHKASPFPRGVPPAGNRRADLGELFAAEPSLWKEAQELPEPEPTIDAWIHGDLHPDQVGIARDGSGLRLLDLDNAGPGDRTRELAGWVVDCLRMESSHAVEQVTDELLAGYVEAGGKLPSRGQLASHVADLCVHAAAACFRRLEEGAGDKAADLLALARTSLSGGCS